MKYYPEGVCQELNKKLNTMEDVKNAMQSRAVLEGRVVLCDREHNLHIDLGGISGLIPYNEGAVGIIEGTVRDIALISKVNKRVCFRVMGIHKDEYNQPVVILSRRSVQLDCFKDFVNKLNQGDIIDARVTRLESFGAFIDIGAGINSLIPIDMLSVSRISHPSQRLSDGQMIRVALKKREETKLTFTLKELLGTWEENACRFSVGETVTGIVRSVESYGIFVELAPNLAGLAELCDGVQVGQRVSVFIKSIIPEKMKIKLIVVDSFNETAAPEELEYFVKDDHLSKWQYSPAESQKQICTVF